MPDQQIVAWVRARGRLDDAEEALQDIRTRAQRMVESLEKWRDFGPTIEPGTWPDTSMVDEALKACHRAQDEFDQAEVALTPGDRKPKAPSTVANAHSVPLPSNPAKNFCH